MLKHAVSRKEKSSSGENSFFLSEFTVIFPVCLYSPCFWTLSVIVARLKASPV